MARISENNLWQATAAETFYADSLTEDLKVDLVIIGGGFTGCSAAIEAQKQGMSVCLLESNNIGHGGSGRNVGLVNAGLWTPPDDVMSILGPEAGEKLNKTLAAGPSEVFKLIEEFDIKCEATCNGTLHCAHSPKGFTDLQNRFAQQEKRQAPVELLSAKEATILTGASGVFGALLDRRAGTVQPLAYAKGLARAAQQLGVKVYENSPAIHTSFKDGVWSVKTARGTVKASYLLNATNAYMQGNIEHYSSSFTPVYYFQFATKPLDDEFLNITLPEKHGCWDTGTVMSSFRLDAAGRLIMGSIGSLEKMGKGVHTSWIKRKLHKLFPQLKGIEFEYSWHGRIAMTDDHLPRLIQIGDSGISMMGYNGRGISPGTCMGTAIAKYFVHGDPSVLPIQPTTSYQQGFNSMKELYYETGASLTHMVKDY
ncbi:NAD(P)/FAD-dependent oxidoreductase [Curvivirga sp.]|uniref:NAD(P)/FAD-dependent oxidoreductase n=1 Tax=Curvivirga sp. TaxID=2856848 RepID=UPI003B58F74F